MVSDRDFRLDMAGLLATDGVRTGARELVGMLSCIDVLKVPQAGLEAQEPGAGVGNVRRAVPQSNHAGGSRKEHTMEVREVMTGAVISVQPDTPVLEARHLMLDKRIRHLLITDPSGRLEGIITDRDIRLNLPSQATSLSVWEVNYLLTRLTVGSVMTKSVVTIGPEAPVSAAAKLMLEHRIGALPVVEAGRLVGIITETDMLRVLVKSAELASALRGV